MWYILLSMIFPNNRRSTYGNLSDGDSSRNEKKRMVSPIFHWLPSGKSYWKWPFIADFPIRNGDFPVSLPEGIPLAIPTVTYCYIISIFDIHVYPKFLQNWGMHGHTQWSSLKWWHYAAYTYIFPTFRCWQIVKHGIGYPFCLAFLRESVRRNQ